MSLLGKILQFVGYTSDFEKNTSLLPLSIEHGRRNTYVAKQYTDKQTAFGKKMITILYELMIIVVILWPVPYALYMTIRDSDFTVFGRSWFQILVAIQYYHGITYFGKNHFYENIVCNSLLKRYISIAIPVVSIVGLCISIFNVVMLNLGFGFFVYDEIYNSANLTGKVFVSILLLIESAYSYVTFLINACIFSINMFYHKQRVTSYANDLNDYIKSSLSTLRKLNNVGVEYTQMKTRFDDTVTILTPFFSALNFIGFITVYFYLRALEQNVLSVPEITNFVLFILIEIVYIIAIQAVNKNINSINDMLSSNTIIAEYFGNKVFNRTMPVHELKINDQRPSTEVQKSVNLNMARQDADGERKTSNSSENTPISINEDNDNEENRDEYHRLNEHYENDNKNKDSEIIEAIMAGKFEMMGENIAGNNAMLRHVMVASVSNQQMLDWMSLRQIVEARWKTFEIFGVEFTDTTLIAKIFGVGVTVLMSAQIGTFLQWW